MIRALFQAVDRDQLSEKLSTCNSDETTVTTVASHPEKNIIRLQLKSNEVLTELSDAGREELESILVVVDGNKGDVLLHRHAEAGRLQCAGQGDDPAFRG
jgi:hypothetical protein